MTFDKIIYNDDVLDALDAMRFSECTPIQEQAIPVAQEGRDLIAIAQTGTGKTAAYLLPVIDQLADGGFPQNAVNCVVMAPTRELALQIDRQMQGFAYFLPVSSLAIYGGTDGKTFDQQKRGLVEGADVVIATPGRLLAHMQMGYVDLSKVSFFILDEADRMLDMGFFDDIMKIAAALPKERQTLLFSATMPPKIRQMAKELLTDPVEVRIAVSKPAEGVEQTAYVCHDGQKQGLLIDLFTTTPPDRVIVFASKKAKVKELARSLRQKKFNVAEMHSDLEQAERERVMLDFKAGRTAVIVATDILSRGIDIDDISLVVNYDVPLEAEDYVHRVGRTARAAKTGRAITFIGDMEQSKFARIEQLIEREVAKAPLPEHLGAAPAYTGRDSRGHGGGRSGGGAPARKGGKPGRRRGDDKPRHNKPQGAEAAPAAPKAEAPRGEGGEGKRRNNRRRNYRHNSSRRKGGGGGAGAAAAG